MCTNLHLESKLIQVMKKYKRKRILGEENKNAIMLCQCSRIEKPCFFNLEIWPQLSDVSTEAQLRADHLDSHLRLST